MRQKSEVIPRQGNGNEIHARSTWVVFPWTVQRPDSTPQCTHASSIHHTRQILHAWLQNLGHETALVCLVDSVKMKINRHYLDDDEAGGKLPLQVSWFNVRAGKGPPTSKGTRTSTGGDWP